MSIDWDIDTITNPGVGIDHDEAVEEIRTEKRHRGEMKRAALYTYRVAYVTRTVGQGTGRRLSYQQYADQLGYAKSYITLLRRLGRAIVVHGVQPDSQLFSALTRGAYKKEVAALLDRDTPVPHRELLRLASGPRPASGSVDGHAPASLEAAVEGTVRRVKAALAEASATELERAEDIVADLFFEIREARKAMSPGKPTS